MKKRRHILEPFPKNKNRDVGKKYSSPPREVEVRTSFLTGNASGLEGVKITMRCSETQRFLEWKLQGRERWEDPP